VKYDLKTRSLDYLVKSIWLCNISNHHNRELGIRMRFADRAGLVLGPDGGHNLMASLKEQLEYVRWEGTVSVSFNAHKH
jgi:hypothetical protein